MKRIVLGCAAGLISLAAPAQDQAAPADAEAAAASPAAAETSGNAWHVLGDRYYLSPTLSWVFADSGRKTGDGQAVSLALGRPLTEMLAVEGFAQFNRFDHGQGSGTAKLLSAGVNGLFFPSKQAPAYLLFGGGYGHASSHPGGDSSYGTLLLEVGGGYWWKPFDLLFLKDVSLRTEAMYRLDAHLDRRTGTTVGNGRKAFDDIVVSVGFNVPIGHGTAPAPPPPAEPVTVVPVLAPADSDGDGVADDSDQCPDTPAGTAVDDKGCPAAPAAPASACKAPAPGEKPDLAGCATGDVIVLKGVSFDVDKDRLTVNAKTILDGVGDALKASPATNVEIGGHTDSRGSDAHNQRLSERRACSVGRYLSSRGVAETRMTASGYGKSKPVADNETDAGREQNRRVELKVLGGPGAGLGRCGAAPAAHAPKAAAAADAAPAAAVPEPVPAAVERGSTSPSESSPPPSEPAAQAAPEAPPPVSSTPPPATESASPAAPAPEAAEPAPPSPPPAAAPAAAETPSPVSSQSMRMVPEGEVFGAPAAESKGPSSSATQMVPEGEVFDSSAPAAAPNAPPAAATQMVPENEVFGDKK